MLHPFSLLLHPFFNIVLQKKQGHLEPVAQDHVQMAFEYV